MHLPANIALDHLNLRMQPIQRLLRQAIEDRARRNARLKSAGSGRQFIAADHARWMLADLSVPIGFFEAPALSLEEAEEESRLRSLAADASAALPILRLERELSLEPYESAAILLCAAPALARDYERVFAYIQDDVSRRLPTSELLSFLCCPTAADRVASLTAFGEHGKLRLRNVLKPVSEAPFSSAQELILNPAHLAFIQGKPVDPLPLSIDPASVDLTASPVLSPDLDYDAFHALAAAIRGGDVRLAALWGPPQSAPREVVRALANLTGLALRRMIFCDPKAPCYDPRRNVRDALLAAAATRSILWLDLDEIQGPEWEHARKLTSEALIQANVPLILTGRHPWRPAHLLARFPYVEINLEPPGFAARSEMWQAAVPEITADAARGLAARYRLTGDELRAVSSVATTRLRTLPPGERRSFESQLGLACSTVLRKQSLQFARLIEPRKGPGDLILPEQLHKQVLEVGEFYLSCPQVYEQWGMRHVVTGGGGLKALFTGAPGTGKTLAAEVIAHHLGLPLLKVDLARVVSKWVGETEKNLDTVFGEAEESHAVLFFDEADSLFGKRGDVQHGADRWANIEVGFLLQRLEDYFGLVVLSSNLKDQLDAAFLRRFQIVLHFPNPGPGERIRIWRHAFKSTPCESSIPFESLSTLDMTGASIVSAAFTAASMAASERRSKVDARHVIHAVARQFQRESRLLDPQLLEAHAANGGR